MKRCMGCMEIYEDQYDVCPRCGYEEGHNDHQLLHIDPGSMLADRYIIGRSLGFGGFGVTYLGWDTKLERKVAIKEYMPSEFATRMIHHQEIMVDNSEKKSKQFNDGMTKFFREGQKLAQVNDIDGIVHMYDCFEANNTAYITMEYLQGETLTQFLSQKETISEQEVLELMLPIFQALETVHEKGIIHRDIAPDNLFVTYDEDGNPRLKLIDFGASKFASSTHSKSLTVMIKPGYSPEEQYRSNGDQGTYTDVYALAAVMYRMVTGVQPPDSFERRTAIESHKRDLLVEPGKFNKNLSANFEIALMNAMNVRIEDRTATIPDFEAELISFEPVKKRGSSIRRIDFMRWPLWAKIGVPVASAAAAGLVVFAITKVFSGAVTKYTLPEGYTRVPDFVMADFDTEAQAWADEAKLTIGANGTRFSPIAASRLVLSQDVQAGSIVSENASVNVILSTGEETFVMPDVTGMRLEDAKKALECMGIEVLTEDGMQDGLIIDGVIDQRIVSGAAEDNSDPSGKYGMIKYGATVTLTVNRVSSEIVSTAVGSSLPDEDGLITVFNSELKVSDAGEPDLTGMSFDEALSKAAGEGWCVFVKQRCAGKGAAEGTVLEQQPSEYPGEEKVLELKVAMPDMEFPLPDLMYKDRETAIELLKNIGIEVEVSEESSEIVSSGLITAQSIEGKDSVKAGDKIVLAVSTGSKPFEMPNVAGLSEEEATRIIGESKLVINKKDTEYIFDENIPDGQVVSQSITEGSEVTRGTEVVLIICSWEDVLSVPDVMDKTADEAVQLLKSSGFENISTVPQESIAEKDRVLEQSPAAGKNQKKDTPIVITVSDGSLAQVASVVGQGYDGAKSALESLGFSVSRSEDYSDSVVVGSVIRQSMQSGEIAKKGTSITLTVSLGKQVVELPDDQQSGGSSNDTGSDQKTTEVTETYTPVFVGWSDWSTDAPPAGTESESMSVTQYRYRTATTETITSGEASLDGWTQTGSSFEWSSDVSWSGVWSADAITAGEGTEVTTKIQERHRDLETTTSKEELGSPWELMETKDDSYWGAEVDNGRTPVQESSTRKVRTETRYETVQTGTRNWYYIYRGYDSKGNLVVTADSESYAQTLANNHGYKNITIQRETTSMGSYVGLVTEDGDLTNDWFFDYSEPIYSYQPYTVYFYSDLVQAYEYVYGKWGDWSGWADTTSAPSNTETREYQTQTLYQSGTRTKIYTYTYQRTTYGDWSEYSESLPPDVSDYQTREVVYYRYAIYQ